MIMCYPGESFECKWALQHAYLDAWIVNHLLTTKEKLGWKAIKHL